MQAIYSVKIAYVRSTAGAFTWQITDLTSEKRNTISIESIGVAVAIAALVAHLKARSKAEFNGPARPREVLSVCTQPSFMETSLTPVIGRVPHLDHPTPDQARLPGRQSHLSATIALLLVM